MSKTDTKYNHNYYQKNKTKVKRKRNQRSRENPSIEKAKSLRRHYGITLDEWQLMWEDQDGKCAICGKHFLKPSNANVDHNHETGKIRGLLCGRCNRGLGHFYDNTELLMKVIKYLDV